MKDTVRKPSDENTKTDDDVIKKDDVGNTNSNTEMGDASTKNDDMPIKTDDDDNTTETEDAKTGTEKIEEEEEEGKVVAPDGGWGWMVTVAGFLVSVLQDGMVTSFGLLVPELRQTFSASLALSSLPPGILVATFLLTSPVTGYLVKRWGCRPVGFCGGLLAALGVGVSAYAANIYIFILGFGLITGFGVGLIYLPSVTMVNMYFHKKRGMVAGIITSGAGFGLLIMAPLTEMLIEQYGWRGCYLIMAAIALHFCVCASLMRPLPRPPTSSPHISQTLEGVEVGVQGEDSWSLVSAQELEDSGEGDDPARGTQLDKEGQSATFLHKYHYDGHGRDIHSSYKIHLVENGQIPHVRPRVRQEENGELYLLAQHRPHHGSLLSSVRNLFLGPHGSHVLSGARTAGPTDSALLRSRSQGHLECRPSNRPHPPLLGNVLSTWLACQVPPSLSQHTLPSHQSSDSMAGRHQRSGHPRESRPAAESHFLDLRKRPRHYSDSRIGFGHSLSTVHTAKEMVEQVSVNHHLINSGMAPFETKASADSVAHENQASCPLLMPPAHPTSGIGNSGVEEDHHTSPTTPTTTTTTTTITPTTPTTTITTSTTPTTPITPTTLTTSTTTPTTPTTTSDCGCQARVAGWLRGQVVFALFLMGAFLIQLVCYVTPLLTPSYAYQYDVSKDQVATVLSIYGLLNTAGRLLAGVLVYWGVRTLHVHNVSMLLSAVACFTLPLSTSFPSIAVSLGLHGFFLGAFPPLQTVILVEYLGLERLASTFGTMCLVKAFASMMGTPLTGVLLEVTGTFTVPLAVCGAVLILSAILHQLMDCWP